MEYRLFGKTGVEVSILGFGMMRLPILNNDPGQIDTVSYTHLRAHETPEHLVCRLLLEKKNNP